MTAEEGTSSLGATGPTISRACLGARDAGLALLLFAAALGLYAATAQSRIYGHDGAFLVNAFALGAEGHSNSAFYASIAEIARAAFGDQDPLAPLLWISHLGAAVGVGATYVIARAMGASPRGALFGASLLAVTPAQWFYATTIETHALHVGAVGVAAMACLLGPWSSPWIARALAAAGVLLLYPTHMTGLLLLPGWILLARVGRERRAEPLAVKPDIAVTGACFALAALLSIAVANQMFGAGFTLFASEEAPVRFLDQFTRRFTLQAFWDGWVLPLFALLILGPWTFVSGRPTVVSARAALFALVLVPVVVLLWLSIPERGAYFLGSAPFLAALCAFAPLPGGGRGWMLAAALVAVQGIAGLGQVAAHDALFPIEERAEAVRAGLGESGVVITLDPNAPRTKVWLPNVEDFDLSKDLTEFAARGASPAEFAAFVVERVGPVVATTPVALDLTYRRLYEAPPEPGQVALLEPYLVACERALQEAFTTRIAPHPWWPLLVIER